MPESPHVPARLSAPVRAWLEDLAATQVGVIAREQLREFDVSPYVVDAMLDGRRWQARGALVLVMHNGPLTRDQQLWLAVLNAGYPAALAAHTAAAQQGLQGWDEPAIEIVVPRGFVVPKNIGIHVKVHESRRFGPEDIHPGRVLPQVRIERALIDAAVWSRPPRTACGIVAAGVQQRL
ncbi:MAG: hypothetical protein ACTHK4_09250, partial [Mycobacteriales bacterium]